MIETRNILRSSTLQGFPILVHKWAAEDVPLVRALALTTWRATYGSFIPDKDLVAYLETAYAPAALLQYLSLPHLCGFIAKTDERPVAFAKTSYADVEKRFYLSSLYVQPEYQGKGIGKLMLNVSEQIGLTFGATEMWLGVMKQNVKALQWYKAIGFTFVHEEPFVMGETVVFHLLGSRPIQKQN